MTKADYTSSLGFAGVTAARGTSASKPISMGTNELGAFKDLYFVTDAKASGSIMNAATMTWVKHFNVTEFGTCSGGGLWVVPHPTAANMVLAVYGKQDGASCIFKVDLQALTMTLVTQLDNAIDAHGLQFCTTTGNDLRILSTNRQTATLDVIKYSDGSYVTQAYDLNTQVFDKIQSTFGTAPTRRETAKLQPDVAYFQDNMLYMAARGPKPVRFVAALPITCWLR